MCVRRERAARNGYAARQTREKSDNSILFDRTKAATFRASCPRRVERDMERNERKEEG